MLTHLHALLSRETQSLIYLCVLVIDAEGSDLCKGGHLEHLVMVLSECQALRRLEYVGCIQSLGSLLVRRR